MAQFASLPLEILTMILSYHLENLSFLSRTSLSKAMKEVAKTIWVSKTWAEIAIHFLCQHEVGSWQVYGRSVTRNTFLYIMVFLWELNPGASIDAISMPFVDAVLERFKVVEVGGDGRADACSETKGDWERDI